MKIQELIAWIEQRAPGTCRLWLSYCGLMLFGSDAQAGGAKIVTRA
ncbi:hypothetical protein P7H06_15610 [Paenibacillus larvae]|nr:hypothetical protein [Paenibacillus larvae]MDT2260648.1 hypothetical protein [Paenibacillus larvae]